MDVNAFVNKWSKSFLKESAGSQSYFDDLCRVIGHPTPSELDPLGQFFTYQKRVTKTSGKQGFADIWYRGYFAWEFKSKGKSLADAYQQLLQYRTCLENPPLLVVSDFQTILIHTDFNNTRMKVYEIRLKDLPQKLSIIKALFFNPTQLKPERQKFDEAFIQKLKASSSEFFTPACVMLKLSELVNLEEKIPNNDPFCGTGAFLFSTIQYLRENAGKFNSSQGRFDVVVSNPHTKWQRLCSLD